MWRRVKAVLRRSHKEPQQAEELAFGGLRMNLVRYEAFLGGEKLALTPKGYELLKFFLTNPGRAFSRDDLPDRVW